MTTTATLHRPLGATGVEVPVLGLGAMQLGDPAVPEARAEAVLRRALELGIRLVDTARSYGLSEARIGRYLASRRDEFVLSTKVGYGIDGVPDWTPEAVRRGIDAARRRLATDVIDIVHLHSCDRATLEHGGVVEALAEAVAAGTVGFAAYSGENDALALAAGHPAIRVVQASVNLCDQAGLAGPLAAAAARGLGILAKRPLATAPWRGEGAEPVYAERFAALAAEVGGVGDWAETALRFSAFAPGVSACLVGTRRPEALEAAVEALAAGPLPGELEERLRAAFGRLGSGWTGLV